MSLNITGKNPPLGLIPSDFQKYSDGKYSGREIIIQNPTFDGDGLLITYKLTGRSEGSRSREMFLNHKKKKLHSKKLCGDVWLTTSPLKEPTLYEAAYQIYEAARIMDGSRTIIITNGHHTDNIVGMARRNKSFGYEKEEYLKAVLSMWGGETDGPNRTRLTARVAAIVSRGKEGEFDGVLGYVDKYWNVETFAFNHETLKKGSAVSVATYRRDTPWMDIPEPMRIEKIPEPKSLKIEIDDSWEKAKRGFVEERATGTKIPTLTSMAWMYLSDDSFELEVRDVKSTV